MTMPSAARINWRGWRRVGLVCLSAMALGGCQAGRYGGDGAVAEGSLERKIQAEAYSFNARLRRQGKPTTFKLEVYQTDNLLGLSGRGYLGKGALKGWLTSDSIKVYFPTTRELLYERLSDLTGGGACPSPLKGLNLLTLFGQLPDSALADTDLLVTADYSNAKRPEFRIEPSGGSCGWKLGLTYGLEKPGWRLRKFEFDDGAGLTLKGTRERYRSRARIALKRFLPRPPPGTTRIIP